VNRRSAIILPLALIALAALQPACSNRLAPHRDLLVGEPAGEAPPPGPGEVAVTYLGTNGYLVRSPGAALLVDPYFTRLDLRSVALDAPVEPSREAITRGREKGAIPRRVDGFLVTHSHFDHLFDVPFLHRRLGGQVVTSKTGRFLCEASGTSRRHLLPSLPGDVHRIGDATVRVLAARHDEVLGRVPYPGLIDSPLDGPPDRPRDWRVGTPLAFLIEIGGRRIYIESGGSRGHLPSVENVDLAIVGVAVRESQRRYPQAVRALSPRFVLPSHQDNFFRSLEEGFHFSPLANFPRIRASHEAGDLPGRLILMDHFHTWTVPGR